MKKLILIIILFFLYKILINPPADFNTRHKLSLIDDKLRENGYHPHYFISSGKRYKWYNNFLRTAKKSYHLKSKAIDIIVFDIDGDFDFDNKDISILEKAAKSVEKENPHLIGAFGTYRKEGGIYYNMVHIDTRGYRVRYDQ